MRAVVLEGQLSLFAEEEPKRKSCHDCASYYNRLSPRERAEQRRVGLANCWLMRFLDDGTNGIDCNLDFSDLAAESCRMYCDSENPNYREMRNPDDRARQIVKAAKLDERKWLMQVTECCEVAMVRCPNEWKRGWYERTKGIADAARMMENGRCPAPSLFAACYSLGVFDYSIDYHVIWDRCWAAKNGVRWSDAVKLLGWDYSKGEPIW